MANTARPPDLYQDDLPERAASAYRRAGRIAWDVETTGLDWRTDHLALCQLFSPSVGVSIIQVGDTIPPNLASLLSDTAVQKVFHHAPFDLRFMVSQWHVPVGSVKCTKVASKLLCPAAPNREHSLAFLVEMHLGIKLSKGSVRTSNWESVELSPEQLQYAANDVLYLIPLLHRLERGLLDLGRIDLHEDCCRFLPSRVQLDLLEAPDIFAY